MARAAQSVSQRLKSWFQSRKPRKFQRRCHLLIERLDERITPAVGTWDGGGGDNKWTTPGNWEGDVAPNPGDDLVFPVGVPRLSNDNNFAAGTAFGSVLLSGNTYTITGNSVKLAGGMSSQGSNNSFGLNVQLTGSSTLGNTGGSTFTLGGTIDLNGHNLAINTTSGTTLLNNSISGTGNLSSGGDGETIFATGNSYSGSTAITGGTLVVRNANGLGTADGTAATGTSLANNAILQLENSITVTGERLTSTTGGQVVAIGNDVWTGNVFFGDPSSFYNFM